MVSKKMLLSCVVALSLLFIAQSVFCNGYLINCPYCSGQVAGYSGSYTDSMGNTHNYGYSHCNMCSYGTNYDYIVVRHWYDSIVCFVGSIIAAIPGSSYHTY